jgi:hypothetical protein
MRSHVTESVVMNKRHMCIHHLDIVTRASNEHTKFDL